MREHRKDNPGRGGRGRSVPKGRQVSPEARATVRALLDGQPGGADRLIENLHRLQDRFGQIPAGHLAALAEQMGLAQAEVFEVASFYAHFDVVKDGEAPLQPLVLRVCDSLPCTMAGGAALLAALQADPPPGTRVVRAPCIGLCDCAPAAEIGHHMLAPASEPMLRAAVTAGETHAHPPDAIGYAEYVASGGYTQLRRLRDGSLAAEDVLATIDAAGLRGLGGAGFPTGRKWRAVRGEPGPRLAVVNADEGEPGTFKDRHFFHTDPHRVIEGALLAAHVVEAERVVIYLRDEYPAAHALLERELALLPPGGPPVELRRGAGAYICGEESAMLESIEGRRGLPRHKPPFPFQSGLFGRPTLINNVETLFWVRAILEQGAAWWTSQGRHGGVGLRAYSVSGRVRIPGVKIAPAGITVRELIDEFCDGMAAGHRLAAYLPGGASGGIFPASMADIPLDFGKLEPHGGLVGSAAVVILSSHDDVRAAALNLMRFFETESCGQCTPCRAGTQKARMLMERKVWDAPLLEDLAAAMRDASICGLGQAAPNPLLTVLRHFPEEAT